MLNSVLGGGYSSRLNQEVRIKRGLSYGVSSALDARREAALFRIGVQTKNESAAEVVKLVQDEMDRLMTQPVGADELAARKTTLIGGFSRSVETTAGLASAIRALVVANRPPAELKERIGQLEAVSAADVQRYAAAHLGAANRRLAVAGEASAFATALQAAQPGLVTVAQDALDLERSDGLEPTLTPVPGPKLRLGAGAVDAWGQGKPFIPGRAFAGTIVPPGGRRMQHACARPPLSSGTLPMATRRSASPSKGPAVAAPAATPGRFQPPSSCARRRPSTSLPGRPASPASSR